MSTFFDPHDKKNKPILDYFENKTWLVIDSSASTRTSIKKSVVQVGSKMSNMFDADNIVDSQKLIELKKPNFIIGNKNITGGSIITLFDIHMKMLGSRLNGGFFVIADENSITEVALALEYEMDGIISLPFTGFTIIDAIINGVKTKISPSPYMSKIEEGRGAYLQGNQERATELFQASLSLHKHPYEAYFFLGQIYNDQQLIEKAIKSYEDSISHNPDYFRSLNKLSSLYYQIKDYKKAYDINFLMAQKYPILPEKIPELIRLSIINKKYEDINNYLKLLNEPRSLAPNTQIYLSAGLAVLGKYFLHHNDLEKGIEALKTAYKFSNGKYEILVNIMNSFEECHKLDVLLELFDGSDLSLWSDNVQGLYFHTIHHVSNDDQRVLTFGEQLLRKKIKEIHIYKGLIERGIKMKRKIGNIETLVLEAINNFPEEKAVFEKLLEDARKV